MRAQRVYVMERSQTFGGFSSTAGVHSGALLSVNAAGTTEALLELIDQAIRAAVQGDHALAARLVRKLHTAQIQLGRLARERSDDDVEKD